MTHCCSGLFHNYHKNINNNKLFIIILFNIINYNSPNSPVTILVIINSDLQKLLWEILFHAFGLILIALHIGDSETR